MTTNNTPPVTATEKREDRCGAFGTATGEACILPADHDGRHVLPYDAAEEITRLRAALAQSRAVVEAAREQTRLAELMAVQCECALWSCDDCQNWMEACLATERAVRALPQPGGAEGAPAPVVTDAMVERAARALFRHNYLPYAWEDELLGFQKKYRDEARAILTAALTTPTEGTANG